MATKRLTSAAKAHRFGGDWTSAKLDLLAKYLKAYATVMKKQNFKTAYIDAFAGSGYRENRRSGPGNLLEFPEMAAEAPQGLLDGSARLALKTDPRFAAYIFIERNAGRCRALEDLRAEFPDKTDAIRIKQGEANEEIQSLCRRDWTDRRAVLFLDPYGLEVEWATVEAIAATQAIDLWLLFPLGIGVNRLATRSGDIPVAWQHRLNLLLGTEDWYQAFYKVEKSPNLDLFDPDAEQVVRASIAVMGQYFINRLKTVFPTVAENPLVLRNKANCPLYLFCFAAGNGGRGGEIALRIANSLLKQ